MVEHELRALNLAAGLVRSHSGAAVFAPTCKCAEPRSAKAGSGKLAPSRASAVAARCPSRLGWLSACTPTWPPGTRTRTTRQPRCGRAQERRRLPGRRGPARGALDWQARDVPPCRRREMAGGCAITALVPAVILYPYW